MLKDLLQFDPLVDVYLNRLPNHFVPSEPSTRDAATDAIARRRPRHLPTLIPRGRGSSRMLEALVACVTESGSS